MGMISKFWILTEVNRLPLSLTGWLSIVFLGVFAAIPMDGKTGSNPGAAHPELYAFDTYLDGHEDVAAALVSTPALISAPSFLNHHTDLASFFQQYPLVQPELAARPDVL